MQNLIYLTTQLQRHLEKLKQTFEQDNKPDKGVTFFQKVKKETEPIFHILDQWERESLDTLNRVDISLYPQQITSTKENMEALLLYSYYKDVRKRRYMEIYKSCHYIYATLLKEIQDAGQTDS